MWWQLARLVGKGDLYQRMRKCERKWRRLGRREREARYRGDTKAADALKEDMTRWMGRYNSAVMRLYPEDYS